VTGDGSAASTAELDVEIAPSRPVEWPEPRGPEEVPATLRLSGPLLSAARWLSQLPGTGSAMRAAVLEVLGMGALKRLPESFHGEPPDDPRPRRAREPRRWSDARLPPPARGDWPRDVAALHDAYTSWHARPDEVAERALASLMMLARQTPAMNVLAACDPEAVMRDAHASTERFARGNPRPLEGIVFLAKDQHDVAGLPTRFGSRTSSGLAERDATQIARLREAGAIVLGKSVMTEWGVSPIGTNTHMKLPRNPHAPKHVAGGSSTGSAVAVALGIGPFATGGDAGGSARVPAAWAGIFGLKPTFGRISRTGESAWGSLNHVGVLAGASADLARFLDVVASAPDPSDPFTLACEPVCSSFGHRMGDGVRGLRIGIDETEWAECSANVSAASRAALAALERDGAKLVPVRIPLARHAPALGIATIGCEGAALSASTSEREREDLALDIRLAMNVAAGVTAGEYLQVQRLRIGLRRQVAEALKTADVIALPVAPVTAPRLDDSAFNEVFSDAALITALCRHTFLANLTGLPAASAPIGIDRRGVPIGLQIIADAWDEPGLLAVLAHLERCGAAEARRPAGAIDLLAGTSLGPIG
jgi:aspartyl-tRNA(Asn)/glutamyl-tRNA(Gln) amidotransferase subunit A